jgi:hypothetical protein
MLIGYSSYDQIPFGVSLEEIPSLPKPDIVFGFTKPGVDEDLAPRVITNFRNGIYRGRVPMIGMDFTILARGRTPGLPKEFWDGHYGHVIERCVGGPNEEKAKTIIPAMIDDFSSSENDQGIQWEILIGMSGLSLAARHVLGDKENPAPRTVRGTYMGTDAGYNTVMHVSDSDRVQKELRNFAENGIKDPAFDRLLEGLVF